MEDLRRSAARLPSRRSTKSTGTKSAKDADEFWTKAQDQGGWWSADGNVAVRSGRREDLAVRRRNSPSRNLTATPEQFPFHFLPFASQMFYDGSLAHLPWLQEMPDPLSTAMWSTWVEINPQTAEKLGIKQGDMVEIASQHGKLQAPGADLARHRARHHRDAGRPGPRELHALRERPRRESDLDSGAADGRGNRLAGLGGDAREDIARRRRARSSCSAAAWTKSRADIEAPLRKGAKTNGASMGNGGRSRPLHGLRGVRGGVPRGKQHPDRRRRPGRARPRHALDPRRALLGRRVSRREAEVPARAVPAVRRRAVRAGLPDVRELSHRRRPERAGLQPLHRHALLRQRVPLQRALLQFLQSGLGQAAATCSSIPTCRSAKSA